MNNKKRPVAMFSSQLSPIKGEFAMQNTCWSPAVFHASLTWPGLPATVKERKSVKCTGSCSHVCRLIHSTLEKERKLRWICEYTAARSAVQTHGAFPWAVLCVNVCTCKAHYTLSVVKQTAKKDSGRLQRKRCRGKW